MSQVTPFSQNGQTRAITAAVSPPTAVKVLPTFAAVLPPCNQYRVVNAGPEIVFLGAGPSAAEASANAVPVTTGGNGIPVLPGAVEIFSFSPDWYFTASTAVNTSTVYITPGEGL